jgi:hypothetical protein
MMEESDLSTCDRSNDLVNLAPLNPFAGPNTECTEGKRQLAFIIPTGGIRDEHEGTPAPARQ